MATKERSKQTDTHDSTVRILSSEYVSFKGVVDRALAAILLVPGIPIIALLVVSTKLTSRGAGIFRQSRVGREGVEFVLYKIRTMRQDAESESGPVWCKKNDSRVTFLGRIMRKLHLDELPQLLNVLKGDMSLIGPRPERPEFTKILAKEILQYHHRLAVKPGITGLAQINLLPDTVLDDARRKQSLDLEYIKTMGLLLDLRILVCTTLRMFGVRGPSINRLLRVDRIAAIAMEFEDQSPFFSEVDSPTISATYTDSAAYTDCEPVGFTDPQYAAIHAVKWLEQQGVRARAVAFDSLEQLHEEAGSKFDDGEEVVVVVAHVTQTQSRSYAVSKPR